MAAVMQHAIGIAGKDMNDGFQVVRGKKGRRRTRQTVSSCPLVTPDDNIVVDSDSLKRRIRQCCDELVGSQFFAELIKTLEQAVHAARCCADAITTQDRVSGCPAADNTQSDGSKDINLAVSENLKETEHCINSCSSMTEQSENVHPSDGHNLAKKVESLGMCSEVVNGDVIEALRTCSLGVKTEGLCSQDVKSEASGNLRVCSEGVKNETSEDLGVTVDLKHLDKDETVEASCHTDVHPDLSLVVYGLGNFASCLTALYQLAWVLALQQHFRIKPGGCETYDPRYTEAEKQILVDLDFTLIHHNEEGKRRVKGVTLVVMPHCGKALFNNLLWANWSPQQLQHLVVLGNSFSAMLESIPQRLWKQNIGYIAKLDGHMREVLVENSFKHSDIFNDLGVHWFPTELLMQLPSPIWSQAEEPKYDADDVEIILQSQC